MVSEQYYTKIKLKKKLFSQTLSRLNFIEDLLVVPMLFRLVRNCGS